MNKLVSFAKNTRAQLNNLGRNDRDPQQLLHAIVEQDPSLTAVVIGPEEPGADEGGAGGNGGGVLDASTVCGLLRGLADNSVVTELSVVGRADLAEFVAPLTSLISRSQTLRSLRMGHMPVGDELGLAVFGALAKNMSLHSVVLMDVELTSAAGLVLALRRNATLRRVDISHNYFGENEFAALVDGLRDVQSGELQELCLAGTGVDDGAVNRLCAVLEEDAANCPALRLVDVGGLDDPTGSPRSRRSVGAAARQRLAAVLELRRSPRVVQKREDRRSARSGGGVSSDGAGDEALSKMQDSLDQALRDRAAALTARDKADERARQAENRAAAATEDASERITALETSAAARLAEAASAMEALLARLTAAEAVAESSTSEVEALRRTTNELSRENTALREEYLTELRAALDEERQAATARVRAPKAPLVSSSSQTEADTTNGGRDHILLPPSTNSMTSSFVFLEDGNGIGGGGKARWRPDADCTHCATCFKEFSLTRRRHHCRHCGGVFCDPCCKKSSSGGGERACAACCLNLKTIPKSASHLDVR